MDEKIVNAVLDAMEKKAKQLGVTGVAVYMDARVTNGNTMHPHVRVVERLERPAQPEDRGPDDTGTNYFGVVMTKVGEMLSTMKDSGQADRPPRKGEFGWPGGLIFVDEGGSRYFAFSGGTGEEDVWIAEMGAAAVGLDPEFHVE